MILYATRGNGRATIRLTLRLVIDIQVGNECVASCDASARFPPPQKRSRRGVESKRCTGVEKARSILPSEVPPVGLACSISVACAWQLLRHPGSLHLHPP